MNIKNNTHSLNNNSKAKDKQITVNTDIAFNYFLHYSFYYKGKSYKGLIHERDFNPQSVCTLVRHITKTEQIKVVVHHSQRLLDLIYKAKSIARTEKRQFRGQKAKVFKAFSDRPKTMLEVSTETNVLRANICRYVAEWRKKNLIDEVRKGFCPISKYRAGYLTTDPSLFIHSKTESHD